MYVCIYFFHYLYSSYMFSLAQFVCSFRTWIIVDLCCCMWFKLFKNHHVLTVVCTWRRWWTLWWSWSGWGGVRARWRRTFGLPDLRGWSTWLEINRRPWKKKKKVEHFKMSCRKTRFLRSTSSTVVFYLISSPGLDTAHMGLIGNY